MTQCYWWDDDRERCKNLGRWRGIVGSVWCDDHVSQKAIADAENIEIGEDDKCRFKGCKNPPVTNTYFCDPHLQAEKEELLLELVQSNFADCVKGPERCSNYELLKILNYPIDAKGKARCSTLGCNELGYRYDEKWRCKECSKKVIFCKENGCNVRMDEGSDYCNKHEASNVVNHPLHYTTGKIETIDVITDWDLNYCEGNVIKYLSRYKHKGEPLQDLKKAAWYLQKLINQEENNG